MKHNDFKLEYKTNLWFFKWWGRIHTLIRKLLKSKKQFDFYLHPELYPYPSFDTMV